MLLHITLGRCGVCDTLGVTRLRLVTHRVYHIYHSFPGVYLSLEPSDAVVYVIPLAWGYSTSPRNTSGISHIPQLPWGLSITRTLGRCGVCDTLGVTRLRLVTHRVYHIYHSLLGVYLSRVVSKHALGIALLYALYLLSFLYFMHHTRWCNI